MKAGTINELLDMLTFALGMRVAMKSIESMGDNPDLQAHLEKGTALARTINNKKSFALTLESNWKTLEIEGAKLTGLIRLYKRATSDLPILKLLDFYATFADKFLSSNSKSPMGIGTAFTLQAQYKMIKQIAILADGEDLGKALGKFSTLLQGKGKATKKLVRWAKELSQFGYTDGSLSDEIDNANKEEQAGADLGRAKKKHDEMDNSDPDAKLNAEMELAEAERNAQNVINNSGDPQGAKQRVLSKAVEMQDDLGFGVNNVTGYAYKTAVGAKFGLNDEQEKMLISSGKVIMAAGAGSGKTHTLTALIEHMCSPKRDGGKGLRSSQILVSSFTVAASEEIKDRVNNKSNVRIAKKAKGFGTVHSLSARNINAKDRQNAVSRAERPLGGKYVGKEEGFYIDQIMLIALRQVAMTGGGRAPKPTNLFTGAQIDFDPNDVEKGLQEMLKTQESLETKGVKMTQQVLDNLKMFMENYYGNTMNGYDGIYNGRGGWKSHDRYYSKTKANHDKLVSLLKPKYQTYTGRGKNTKFVFNYSPKYNVGDEMTSGDVDKVNEIFANLPMFDPYKSMRDIRIATTIRTATLTRTSADAKKKKEPIKYFKKEEVKWWETSAGQWFNIGIDLAKLEDMFGKKKKGEEEDVEGDGGTLDQQKNLVKCLGKASRLIAVLKGKGISPTEAWYKVGMASEVNQIGQFDPYVAVYAAYEWLLGNTPQVPRDGDMTDIIIDAVRTLVRNPNVLAELQAHYKLILVDEAQDLNRVQHLFFGLIAGTIDPQTLADKPESEMSASMYAMIGDDKQAIYGFQGADSKEMIGKSDQMGGDFTTNLITTNYRSGKNIVDMANQFIAYNEDQIPMTCKANTQKNGMGEVQLHEVIGARQEGAKKVGAAKVMELMLEKKATTDGQWKDFGIGVRTNSEGEIYALACLERGIPFKGRYNPLKKKEYKGVLAFFKLAKYMLTGSIAEPAQVLYDITRYPKSFIKKNDFMDYFNTKSNPLKALMSNAYQTESSFYRTQKTGKVSTMGKRVDDLVAEIVEFGAYISNLDKVTSRAIAEYLFGTPEEEDGVQVNEPLKRNGQTILDSIAEEIRSSSGEINKLQVPGGKVSEGMIYDAAVEKLGAVAFLIELGDSTEIDDDTGEEYERQGTVFDLIDFTNKVEDLYDGDENSDGDNTDKDDSDIDAVRIMTCHGWKGLEVDTMFVPCGMSWPRNDTTIAMTKQEIIDFVKEQPLVNPNNGEPIDKQALLRSLLVQREEMESERRLMYVAMTRAEQSLHLVHTIARFPSKEPPYYVHVGSHFFQSKEICIQPTSDKVSTLLEEWGGTMIG